MRSFKTHKASFYIFGGMLIGIVFSSLISCGSSGGTNDIKFTVSPPFEVKDAYVREWLGGSPEAGRGVDFFIELGSVEQETELDSVFYGRSSGAIEARNGERYFYSAKLQAFEKGTIMDSDPLKEAANKPRKKRRFAIAEGSAVLKYNFEGKSFYTRIDGVRKAEKISYPSGRPQEHQ